MPAPLDDRPAPARPGSVDLASPVDLARQPDFRLGTLSVRPSLGQVEQEGQSERLQPRIMQVLVALHRAGGEVVSRDDLLASCWGGLALGDDVINRCIGRLRKLADDSQGGFVIETIPRVGYRLVQQGRAKIQSSPPQATDTSTPRSVDRRLLIGGAVGAAALVLVGGGWWASRRAKPRRAPEVQVLYERGEAAFQQGSPNDNAQAVAFFEQALERAPNDADIIGALALAYRFEQTYGSPNDLRRNIQRTDLAVARCLAIDPDNRNGLAAQALMLPFGRSWFEVEQRLRQGLKRLPDDGLLLTFLGKALASVGRVHEAVEAFRKASQLENYVPLIRDDLVNALYATGQTTAADRAIDEAATLWPRDSRLWRTRFWLYADTGRESAALAHLQSPAGTPVEIDPDALAALKAAAAALADKTSPTIDAALVKLKAYAAEHPAAWDEAIGFAAEAGRIDQAFAWLDVFLAPYSNPDGQRLPATKLLFRPPLRSLRSDPRFNALTRQVGLEDYWARSGSRPDPA